MEWSDIERTVLTIIPSLLSVVENLNCLYVDGVRERELWEAAMETDAVEALDGDWQSQEEKGALAFVVWNCCQLSSYVTNCVALRFIGPTYYYHYLLNN